jgi:hypothetical protein
MGQVTTRVLVRQQWHVEPDGRAVAAVFLDDGVLVFCDDGTYRVLTQVGMVDVWEVLWNDAFTGEDDTGGWVIAC